MSKHNEHIEKWMADRKEMESLKNQHDLDIIKEMIREMDGDYMYKDKGIYITTFEVKDEYFYINYNQGWFIGKTIGNDSSFVDRNDYRVRVLNKMLKGV